MKWAGETFQDGIFVMFEQVRKGCFYGQVHFSLASFSLTSAMFIKSNDSFKEVQELSDFRYSDDLLCCSPVCAKSFIPVLHELIQIKLFFLS